MPEGQGKGKKEILDLDDPFREADEGANDSGIIAMPAPMRDRQMTLCDEDLTEQARLASVLMDSLPPPTGADAIRARLAPLSRVPVLAKSLEELADDMKEPKTAFVIGFVDGLLPLETIVEVTGLPELESLQILDRLIAQGAIVFPR